MRDMIETGDISSEDCAYEIIDRITENKDLTPEDQ